jgi:hypothetical protein
MPTKTTPARKRPVKPAAPTKKPAIAPAAGPTTAPRIGAKGRYGIYAGIARGRDGGPDYAVEVIEAAPKDRLTWTDAVKWATSAGGELPTRKEQALLFANVPELFEANWYWSGEQSAGYASYAWSQSFSYGGQGDYHEDNKLRVRAVRRVARPRRARPLPRPARRRRDPERAYAWCSRRSSAWSRGSRDRDVSGRAVWPRRGAARE